MKYFMERGENTFEGGGLVEHYEGERAANLVKELYDELPPRLACHLVESSVVLTLAGHKAGGEFHLSLPREEEKQREEFVALQEWIQKMNAILERKGHPTILFVGFGKTFEEALKSITERGKVFRGGVQNLEALERLSKNTHIPGIQEYNSATGVEGARLWARKCQDMLQQARDEGALPRNLTDGALRHLLAGFTLGYPDRALLDHADWTSQQNQDVSALEYPAPAMFAGQYRGPRPDFGYYPDHAQDPDIQNNIRKASEILRGFYESEAHKKLKNDPTFLEARKVQEDLRRSNYESETKV